MKTACFTGDQAEGVYGKLQKIIPVPSLYSMVLDERLDAETFGRRWQERSHPCVCGMIAGSSNSCPPLLEVFVEGLVLSSFVDSDEWRAREILLVVRAPELLVRALLTIMHRLSPDMGDAYIANLQVRLVLGELPGISL